MKIILMQARSITLRNLVTLNGMLLSQARTSYFTIFHPNPDIISKLLSKNKSVTDGPGNKENIRSVTKRHATVPSNISSL